MDCFSLMIKDQLLKEFPEWESYVGADTEQLEIDIPSKFESELGGIVIQTTEDKSILIRNYLPCTGYWVENFSELLLLIKGIFLDEILWIIENENGEWVGTTLINRDSEMKSNPGISYKVLSWSGSLDREF